MKVNKADEFYKILERKAIYPVFQPMSIYRPAGCPAMRHSAV